MTPPVVNKARLLLPVALLIASVVCILPARADDKLKPEDLVAKHLESIDTAEARARVNGTRIKGTCSVAVRPCGEGQIEGQVLMAPTDAANLINMNFEIATYSQEALRFDGKMFATSQLRPDSRTCLAQFFLENEVLFKEGLVGGVLSESGSLLNLAERSPKLEYSGLKKIGDKQLRSDYARTVYASGLPPAQNQQASPARIEAYEEFADFKDESGLNLPHTYKFHLSIQSEVRPAVVDWVFTLNDFHSPHHSTPRSSLSARRNRKRV